MKRRDYLAHAFSDAGIVELRHQDGDCWTSGVFSDAIQLREAARALGAAGNMYTTLNAPVRIEVTNAMMGRALRDQDIGTIVRLPFDFDPIRPTGAPSSEVELGLARSRRDRFVTKMSKLGWPLAAVATSGNGAHAVYRCQLPNTPDIGEMLATVYRGLRDEFSDDEVQFDSTVRNPARIWRLYGTVNRKGKPTAERPHRPATVVIPNCWSIVSIELIEALAAKYSRRPTPAVHRLTIPIVGAGDYSTLDVKAWFIAHGLYKRPAGGGKHAVYCPWRDQHTTSSSPESTDTVIWAVDGDRWPTFHCSHDHCEGRSLTDVMNLWRDADTYCARPYRRRAFIAGSNPQSA